MPLEFRGAQKAIQQIPKYEISKNIEDYWETIHKIHDDTESVRLLMLNTGSLLAQY